MQSDKIIIIDFGSQYTQLIARKVRELQVYCEIISCHHAIELTPDVKGVILSGSPFSVNDPQAPHPDVVSLFDKVPVLGVCYGAQLISHKLGGKVEKSDKREYGRAHISIVEKDILFEGIEDRTQVWMSHSDSVKSVPDNIKILATTDSIPVAAYSVAGFTNPIYGLQFHPEVYHSTDGIKMLDNFLTHICNISKDWTAAAYVDDTVKAISELVGDKKVVMALSGGVDSTVAATLIQKAIGDRLTCIFVDNGLLRKDEFNQVLDGYKTLGLNTKGIDAKELFYGQLKGVTDPEQKRKIIGRLFIEVFQEEAKNLTDVSFLGQGTIYPDVIESVSVHGPSVTIKSHHNVGGLPDTLNLKLVEPLRQLFKDEVRRIGKELNIPAQFLERHPFPGPGLGIRILGEVTPEKVNMLQNADQIYINILKEKNIYNDIWQAGAILLPVQSVGVMGDERTYEFTVALRAVTSTDGMTADWAHIPYDILAQISNDIINQVKGINRVVYDISSKPPATIEWE